MKSDGFIFGLAVGALLTWLMIAMTSCASRDPNRDFSNLKHLSDAVENAQKDKGYYE